MKNGSFRGALLFVLAVELAGLLLFAVWDTDKGQDAVLVNEALHSVQADWDRLEKHERT